MPQPRSPWQRWWARWHRRITILAGVIAIVAAVAGVWGVASVFFAIALGLGAFAGGPPSDNGNTRAQTFISGWNN